MYSTKDISPLDLHLDEQNPRFKITVNPSQKDIREYMIMHENVLRLATKMAEMNTILPGERIIIYNNNGKHVVLEGNRRTCAYQLFLNRNLIPINYLKNFPKASDSFLKEISNIPVDVVNTREEAMAFLAARHIEGVKFWSSVSKWRISYEYYCNNVPIKEIASILALSVSKVKSSICDYKILLRGLDKKNWTKEEQIILSPLDIKPDKLIRLFHLSGTTRSLGLYFDDNYDLKSSFITDSELDSIIQTLTKKAFIDNTINTRTQYSDVSDEISKIVKDYKVKTNITDSNKQIGFNTVDNNHEQKSGKENIEGSGKEKDNETKSVKEHIASGEERLVNGIDVKSGTQNNTSEKEKTEGGFQEDLSLSAGPKGTGGSSNLPYFFQGISFGNLNPNDPDSHGISRVCKETQLFSNRKLVDAFPIAAAFLMRAIIEHSLIYYSKKHKIQGQNKLIWENISNNGTANNLSFIINNYKKNLSNYILDSNMKAYFTDLFGEYNKNISPLNWVVHRPEEYLMPSKDLIELPRKGLLALINYLIS
ncbi:hypothetical protein [Anaerotignum propionicum]|uniref:hypothetical protein n=1 Tax=Anaerotignum propionicum TaxID=28446 RepID=UPI00289ED625|nr:hypothetical protein [Anaerotignum propionicum]